MFGGSPSSSASVLSENDMASMKDVLDKIRSAKKVRDVAKVQKRLDGLGEPDRSVFICAHMHGNGLDETARLCKLSVGETEDILDKLEERLIAIFKIRKVKPMPVEEEVEEKS